MKHKRWYIFVVCICSIAALCGCISFLFSSYESFVKTIITVSKKPYLESLLRTKIFTYAKYNITKNICIIMLAVIPLCNALLLRFRLKVTGLARYVIYSIWHIYKKVKTVYLQNTKAQNITIAVSLIIITAKALYYIIQYDLQYDEMWSYNYFTAQPFYYSFVVNSNYPLYEIITGLFKYLPFEMKVNIRLPVLLAGLLSCVVFYACLRAFFKNHLAAFGGMIVFAFMPVSTFYMLYARGVMLALLFAIISIFSIIFWLRNKTVTAYLVVYALSCAAGIYAMPTNVYLCALLFLLPVIICFANSKKYIKYIVAANAAAGLMSLLFYLPIIAGSGISFLYNAATNTSSAPPTWNNIFIYNSAASVFFTGYTSGLFLCIAVAFVLVLINKNVHQYVFILSLSVCLYFLPALIYKFQNVQLPLRALAFAGLIIPFTFSVIIFVLTKKIVQSALFCFILITGIWAAFISHKHKELNWSLQLDKEAKQLAYLFMQNHIATCYDNSKGSNFFYDYPALEYYYRIQKKTFALTINDSNSLRYKPFNIADKYDCVISKTDDPLPDRNYLEIYRNTDENFKILLRK